MAEVWQKHSYIVHIFREGSKVLVMETSPRRVVGGKPMLFTLGKDIKRWLGHGRRGLRGSQPCELDLLQTCNNGCCNKREVSLLESTDGTGC